MIVLYNAVAGACAEDKANAAPGGPSPSTKLGVPSTTLAVHFASANGIGTYPAINFALLGHNGTYTKTDTSNFDTYADITHGSINSGETTYQQTISIPSQAFNFNIGQSAYIEFEVGAQVVNNGNHSGSNVIQFEHTGVNQNFSTGAVIFGDTSRCHHVNLENMWRIDVFNTSNNNLRDWGVRGQNINNPLNNSNDVPRYFIVYGGGKGSQNAIPQGDSFTMNLRGGFIYAPSGGGSQQTEFFNMRIVVNVT